MTSPRKLDIYKKGVTLLGMKTKSRSTAGKGMNLSTRVINQRKGRGAYLRKNRYNKHD